MENCWIGYSFSGCGFKCIIEENLTITFRESGGGICTKYCYYQNLHLHRFTKKLYYDQFYLLLYIQELLATSSISSTSCVSHNGLNMVGIKFYSSTSKNGCLNYTYFACYHRLGNFMATWKFFHNSRTNELN